MNIDKLREELKVDEGVKYEIYLDHLGLPTFGIGRPRLSKFKGMKRGVDARDWHQAAMEMVDSNWYKQVTNRAQRLVDRMQLVRD